MRLVVHRPRPIAHSVLVDLLHHIRNDLSRNQLSRVIHMYSQNLHDLNFAPNIQTMCAKLLLNIVDCIAQLENKQEGTLPIYSGDDTHTDIAR